MQIIKQGIFFLPFIQVSLDLYLAVREISHELKILGCFSLLNF